MPDGRIIGAGLVLTGAALALWGFADRDADDTQTITQKISVVQLNGGAGDVRIETADTDGTTVREHREFWLFNTGKARHVEGEKLVLDGDCGWQCTADFVITVPRGTKVTGKVASGDLILQRVGDIDVDGSSSNITATDSSGSVTIDVASGDLTVDGASGAVDIEAKSGDVKAGRLTGGPITVKASSGDIDVSLDKPASVTAEGRSSDVKVHVPAGSYRVDASAKSGDTDIKVANDPNGTNVVKVTTSSGDVEVTGG